MLARIDLDGRLLVCEQDPVTMALGQFPPRLVDVVAEGDENVAQVLPLPGAGPCGDRALADGQRRVGNQGLLRHLMDPAQSVALRAGADRGVRRERIGVESFGGPGRIRPGPREQHPQQIGQGRDGAHRRPRGRRPSPLLECDGGWQTRDVVHLRRAGRQQQASGVRRDGLEVPALRLGVNGPEGERRFARPGNPGEGHQRVARGLDVDSPQVVHPATEDPNARVDLVASRIRGCWHAGQQSTHAGPPVKHHVRDDLTSVDHSRHTACSATRRA